MNKNQIVTSISDDEDTHHTFLWEEDDLQIFYDVKNQCFKEEAWKRFFPKIVIMYQDLETQVGFKDSDLMRVYSSKKYHKTSSKINSSRLREMIQFLKGGYRKSDPHANKKYHYSSINRLCKSIAHCARANNVERFHVYTKEGSFKETFQQLRTICEIYPPTFKEVETLLREEGKTLKKGSPSSKGSLNRQHFINARKKRALYELIESWIPAGINLPHELLFGFLLYHLNSIHLDFEYFINHFELQKKKYGKMFIMEKFFHNWLVEKQFEFSGRQANYKEFKEKEFWEKC